MKQEEVEIIPFDSSLSPYFYDLNVAWLKKYFYVEPYDEKVLSDPQSFIIDKGGFVFFAKLKDEIVGVVSLINQDRFFELSKMAVVPKHHGKKIGQKLVEFAIEFALESGWNNLILYSNRKLVPAITLYKKLGFKEVALEKDVNYERADIKMEIVF
ncbi:MAG: GNAT family N-acetyltransferase [Flavobacteriaceae bacterium]|nr:GNAT family N-acetyltransferase [Flavobacteriaceae bacterium]